MTTIPEEQPAADDPYRTFMRLFTRHEGALRCFVRTLLPTWDDVDEVMQDVSIAAWTKFGRFDPQTDFARWAATIARYEVLNYRRTKARDRLVFDEDLILLLADECQEEFAQSEQERQALDGCLDKLPSHQRELVLRVYSAGQKIKADCGRDRCFAERPLQDTGPIAADPAAVHRGYLSAGRDRRRSEMSEPAGWQWIEAWRNGTISDEDFASLQKLLREEPDARRTLRRYMAMDTALRDRAEARLLIAASEAADEPSRARSAAVPRSRFAWREVVAWSTAAACLLVATMLWFTRPTTNQNPPMIAEAEPPTESPVVERRRNRPAVVSTIAQQREQLLASAPDVLHLQLVSDNGGGVANESGGDIVWSSGRQIGYLRLRGLAGNDPAQRQYQLWIVGSDVSGNELINGGIFPVDRSTGELILPIQADQFVQQPKMFVVSVEPSGSGAALTTPLLAKADGIGP